jgi:hypothetical protein
MCSSRWLVVSRKASSGGSGAAKILEIRLLSLPKRDGFCACREVFDETFSVVGEVGWRVIIKFGSWYGAIAGYC